MTGERNSRAKKIATPPADMISDLPSSLIESILIRLTIRDAVRTSILSRKWRYNWTNLPKLVFDDSLLPQHPNRSTSKKLLFTIYRILLLQNTPTLKFTLWIYELEPCAEVDLLVLYLSRNNVEKLTLSFWKGEYKVPESLFSCLRLTQLRLSGCAFEPPLAFNGFSCLTRLEFAVVSFNAETFGSFISSCPLLEKLVLVGCTSFCFELSAPKLKSLYFEGNIDSLYFKNVPLLAIVSLQSETEVITSGLIKFLESLPVLEDLEMNYHFFKSLAAVGGVPEKLPTTLVRLKNLNLFDISLATLDMVLPVLCLIRSSPNLESFSIQSFPCVGVENLISEDRWDLSLNQLREVSFSGASGSPAELEFIKRLLAKSPILENVLFVLTSKDYCDRVEILESRAKLPERVVQFKRASPNAEIVFATE